MTDKEPRCSELKTLTRVEAKLSHVSADVSGILFQLKTLNGKVARNSDSIHEVKLWQASHEGKVQGGNNALRLMLIIAGIIIGALSTMLWH